MDTGLISVIIPMFGNSSSKLNKVFIESLSVFGEVLFVSNKNTDPEKISHYPLLISNHVCGTETLNRAYHEAKSKWILILEPGEEVSLNNLQKLHPEQGCCYKAVLESGENEFAKRNYAIRMIPKIENNSVPFSGNLVPDVTEFIYSNKLKVSGSSIIIKRSSELSDLNYLEEVHELTPETPMDSFWQAVYCAERQKFYRAEKLFRQSMNTDFLLEFYHLAARNGLAISLFEQHRLDDAFEIADESVLLNNRQYTPWILMHKICWMKSDWIGAYQYLEKYLETEKYNSESGFDIRMSRSDSFYLLAEVSLYNGDYSKAFRHLEKFFEINNGEVSDEIPEKLLIFAAELKLKEKAIFYFNEIYNRHTLEKPDEKVMNRLLETLSLIEDNGWNDFASNIYEKLIAVYPGNHKILQGWLTSLIRSNQLQKAKVLMENIKNPNIKEPVAESFQFFQ